jgi:hypothetical protein
MDDEELRSEFAALVAPVQQIPVPDSLGLRRRVRRRRAGQATASALACACVAAAAGLFFRPSAAPPTTIGTGHASGCASRDLVVRWLPPAQVTVRFIEGPPQTYLLVFRNIGATACSLAGWPRFVIAGSGHPRSVSVSYKTHFDEWVGTARTRVVEPTRILLEPGAAAVSVVSVELTIVYQKGCVTRAWLIGPPSPGAAPVPSRGKLPEICDGSLIDVSAFYPPSVPITNNYP